MSSRWPTPDKAVDRAGGVCQVWASRGAEGRGTPASSHWGRVSGAVLAAAGSALSTSCRLLQGVLSAPHAVCCSAYTLSASSVPSCLLLQGVLSAPHAICCSAFTLCASSVP
eukprot:32393-Pelagomonas_calceolata.AAC.1